MVKRKKQIKDDFRRIPYNIFVIFVTVLIFIGISGTGIFLVANGLISKDRNIEVSSNSYIYSGPEELFEYSKISFKDFKNYIKPECSEYTFSFGERESGILYWGSNDMIREGNCNLDNVTLNIDIKNYNLKTTTIVNVTKKAGYHIKWISTMILGFIIVALGFHCSGEWYEKRFWVKGVKK